MPPSVLRRVERNAQRSLENAVNHFEIAAMLGVSPDGIPEQNMRQLRRMWSGRPEDAAHRSTVLRAMRAQSMEFSELSRPPVRVSPAASSNDKAGRRRASTGGSLPDC